MNSTSKARREASRNKFMQKSVMPDRVEILGKVDRSKNRPRTRLGFVKRIGNWLRKIKNMSVLDHGWSNCGSFDTCCVSVK